MPNVNKAFTVGYAELTRIEKWHRKLSLRLFGDKILPIPTGKIGRVGLLSHVAVFRQLVFKEAKLIRKFRVYQYKSKEHATNFLAER